MFVSSSLIELPTLPRQLVIIGGGYVGLEFASFYTDFGAQVTILQNSDAILAHEDPETAEAVRRSLEDRGVTIVYDAHVTHIDDEHDQVLVFAQVNGEEKRYPGHAVLVAVGRTPQHDRPQPGSRRHRAERPRRNQGGRAPAHHGRQCLGHGPT